MISILFFYFFVFSGQVKFYNFFKQVHQRRNEYARVESLNIASLLSEILPHPSVASAIARYYYLDKQEVNPLSNHNKSLAALSSTQSKLLTRIFLKMNQDIGSCFGICMERSILVESDSLSSPCCIEVSKDDPQKTLALNLFREGCENQEKGNL